MSPTEKPGKTLHLLKASSKPVPAQRVRRKVQILGTYDHNQESKKKPPAKGPSGNGQPQPGQPPIPSSIISFMAPQPNQPSIYLIKAHKRKQRPTTLKLY